MESLHFDHHWVSSCDQHHDRAEGEARFHGSDRPDIYDSSYAIVSLVY